MASIESGIHDNHKRGPVGEYLGNPALFALLIQTRRSKILQDLRQTSRTV